MKLVLFFQALIIATTLKADIHIKGWLLPDLALDSAEFLGSDPVLGRLTCPSFSRLNLKTQESESIFFSEISIKDEKTWVFHFKTGIFWWNGKEVKTEEVADFFSKNIASQVKRKSASSWMVPNFTIKINGQYLQVHWVQKPVFGPYILNGIPLKNSEGQCAGVYHPRGLVFKKGATSIILDPTPGYAHKNQKKESIIFHSPYELVTIKPNDFLFEFIWPQSMNLTQKETCQNIIPTPWVSLIHWKSQKVESSQIRKGLAHAIPRQDLLKFGAAHFGFTPSGIVPLQHPGFNKALNHRSYSVEMSKENLKKFQSTLNVKTESKNQPMSVFFVEKIISDSLIANGIKVSDHEPFDAELKALFLPMPEMNMIDDFYSKNNIDFKFEKKQQQHLDEELLNYSLSLTHKKPDFNSLKRIESILYENEPYTVIMQHGVCFRSNRNFKPINSLDPDWFRTSLYEAASSL